MGLEQAPVSQQLDRMGCQLALLLSRQDDRHLCALLVDTPADHSAPEGAEPGCHALPGGAADPAPPCGLTATPTCQPQCL